ncbi:MAG TPA: MBL fold metallo-hydrolase, partial [Chloroflexota bacterium]|nr:MBL fold metallo-hydrolase [Chloroflexota bacterium]
MDIVWFGNSCFRLQSSQATVLTDPFDPLPAAAISGVQIVTVSDRALRDRVPPVDGARVVDGPGEYEIKGVPVNGLAVSAAGATAGEPARRTFIYTVTLDGIAVCHLGRLAEPPTGPRIQEMGQPDVLFIPLGEPHGLPVPRAVQLASQLEAKLLIPMTLGGAGETAALEAFCKELGADPTSRENRLNV